MINPSESLDQLIYELKERAKELNCLYEVQELLSKPEITINEICNGIVKAIPPGWQFPDVCQAKITLSGSTYQSPDFQDTPWVQSADIVVQDKVVGRINVYYTEERPESDEGPFLKEERKLIETIAEQFGNYILHQQLKEVFEEQQKSGNERKTEWWAIFNLLKRTDPNLLMRISRKMIDYLGWSGVQEAERLLMKFSPAYAEGRELLDENRPFQIESSSDALATSDEVFNLASQHLSEAEILESIHQWIKEDQSGFLINVLVSPSSSLTEISSAIQRYHLLAPQGLVLSVAREKSVRVALIRRLLSDQPQFIHIAEQYMDVDDFNDLTQRMIFPVDSHGKLGGKGSGLFLASQILKNSSEDNELLQRVKTPKTWYIASDSIFHFMSYNNLEDFVEQKYKDLSQVRHEYPYILHVFKNSPLPPELVKGLSLALDDLANVPLIVRSSSLLEDQMGMAFAGKYKSLFIANQGTKEERLIDLMGAITEVYASSFGPDPIEYRVEHDLVDHHEEMGIMIQEVVGTNVGHYFFPVCAGVAFSNNEFRWSSRIKREDGLIRMVPGLGTRAVDRLSDDYPVLVTPGHPGLRVNVTLDEIIRYSPKKIDVINLETGSFETIDIRTLLDEFGNDYPKINQCISIISDNYLHKPRGIKIDFQKEDYVVTFDGMMTNTPFLKQIHSILDELQEKFDYPVDIEFAYDGKDFYLLQCRSQSYSEYSRPASIPKFIPEDKIIFSADRYITNGMVSDITHIVYVNPQEYSELSNHQDMLDVGRAVGKLNQLLPKRQFILMGPGRWGSRGDIKLGVSVTYSDINNSSMLIEIARKQKDYIPDPSFGTHFFQDLVEAKIRYLPLYPEDRGILFNEAFLMNSKNNLSEMLPEFSHLSHVIRVIDIENSYGGSTITILMNANENKAIGILTDPKIT